MADDMGYSDPGFMGSGIETPNINRLAKNGITFSQFYNTGRSCPTRASLLTGLYSHKTGMGWMTASNLGSPGYTGDLNQQCVTIAQVLKKAEYSCYVTGKWHVTHDKFMKPNGPKHNWPLQRGFDRFFGHLTGGGSYYSTSTLTYGNEQLKAPANFYLTNAVTDSTVAFITKHINEKKNSPFFFYVAYYAPHRPLHALKKDVDKYRGRFMNGWDKHREMRFNQLKKLGMIDEHCVLSERDKSVPAWDSLNDDEKKIWDARMAVYAAQIDCMDQGIGKIISLLEKTGELENTIIFFLSDNGGCDEEQGGNLKVGELEMLGNERPAQSYRTNWANVSNTPFREYKHYVHQGGIVTPLIVHWPGKITSRGAITKQVGHVIDLMPTITEIAGGSYPEELNGKSIHKYQGKSLLSCLNGKVFDREPIFFEHQANRAVIDGNWKLVSKGNNQFPWEGPWELYNLKDDPIETRNLARQIPQKVEELNKKWNEWAVENNVYPLDNRDWFEKIKADKESNNLEN